MTDDSPEVVDEGPVFLTLIAGLDTVTATRGCDVAYLAAFNAPL